MAVAGHVQIKTDTGVDVGEPNPTRLMRLQNRRSTQIPGCQNVLLLLLLDLVPVKSEDGEQGNHSSPRDETSLMRQEGGQRSRGVSWPDTKMQGFGIRCLSRFLPHTDLIETQRQS